MCEREKVRERKERSVRFNGGRVLVFMQRRGNICLYKTDLHFKMWWRAREIEKEKELVCLSQSKSECVCVCALPMALVFNHHLEWKASPREP